jgi:nucleotide-binding universal stress UspA family protein
MPFHRIVIGVDFSTASLNAVRWVATRFAPRATLFLAHVIPRPRVPTFLLAHTQAAWARAGEEPTLYPGLSGFADLAGASRAEVTVRYGQPATELAALAREVEADLVCVGRSSKRRGTARFGATTPQRLLEGTNLSVLLVPGSASPARPMTLLAAVSDGVEAPAVLRSAGALAYAWDAQVDVLHAVDAGILAMTAAAPPPMVDAQSPRHAGADGPTAYRLPDGDGIRQLTEAWLARQSAEVPLLRGRTTTIAHIGDAAEAIIGYAARSHLDLIVMGRRIESSAIGGVAGCVGSATRLITWAAPCPVLVMGSKGARTGIRRPLASDRASRWDESRASTTRRTVRSGERGSGAPPGGGDAA